MCPVLHLRRKFGPQPSNIQIISHLILLKVILAFVKSI